MPREERATTDWRAVASSFEHSLEVYCPSCGRIAGGGPELHCSCGQRLPRPLVLPPGVAWRYGGQFGALLERYKDLRLMGNYVGRRPERLQSLTHLEYLWLSHYPGFRFEWLANCPRLAILELDYCPIESLEGLGRLEGLRELSLSECRKLRSLEGVGECRGLRTLSFSVCNQIESHAPIADCGELQRLAIVANRMDDIAFVEELPQLEDLILDVTVKSRDLRPLFGAPLRRLAVRRRGYQKGQLDEFRALQPDCLVELL